MCTFQQAISHIKEDKLMHPVHLKKSASTEPLSPKNVAILMWKVMVLNIGMISIFYMKQLML